MSTNAAKALLLEETYEEIRKVNGEKHPDTLKALHQLAYHYQILGMSNKAASLIENGIGVMQVNFESSNQFGSIDWPLLKLEHLLGSAYASLGKFAEAKKIQTECLEAVKVQYGITNKEYLLFADHLSCTLWGLQSYEDLIPLQEEILSITGDVYGDSGKEYFIAISNLHRTLIRLGRMDEAKALSVKGGATQIRRLRKRFSENRTKPNLDS